MKTAPQAKRHKSSHHFISLSILSNFFGSYQLKGKYDTNIQLIISLHFSSFLLSIERQKLYKHINQVKPGQEHLGIPSYWLP